VALGFDGCDHLHALDRRPNKLQFAAVGVPAPFATWLRNSLGTTGLRTLALSSFRRTSSGITLNFNDYPTHSTLCPSAPSRPLFVAPGHNSMLKKQAVFVWSSCRLVRNSGRRRSEGCGGTDSEQSGCSSINRQNADCLGSFAERDSHCRRRSLEVGGPMTGHAVPPAARSRSRRSDSYACCCCKSCISCEAGGC
jgi:hypothetical protein